MRKLLGYIPLDPGEDFQIVAKETDVTKIEDQWFKLVEVWIPGTAVNPKRVLNVQPTEYTDEKGVTAIRTDCEVVPVGKKDEFLADPLGKLCVNCGKARDEHVFFTICPKKDDDENDDPITWPPPKGLINSKE